MNHSDEHSQQQAQRGPGSTITERRIIPEGGGTFRLSLGCQLQAMVSNEEYHYGQGTNLFTRCGYLPALAERMREWLARDAPAEVRDGVGECCRQASCAFRELLERVCAPKKEAYRPHDALEYLARQLELAKREGDRGEEEAIHRYLAMIGEQKDRKGATMIPGEAAAAAPFFSVLIPTYNQEAFLPAALESLLAQSLDDWEAVIVNDGSTDGTAQVMERYAAADSRFRVFHQENGGVGAALNTALEKTHGKWLCWLSSDDLFESDALETFAAAIDADPVARFFHSDFFEMDDATGIRTPSPDNRHKALPPPGLQTLQFFNGNYVHGISIAVHRSVFAEIGEFNTDFSYGQDVDMWLRASARFRLHHIRRRTCVSRQHSVMGTATFPQAGPMDVARSALEFLNRSPFPACFPFLDLGKDEELTMALRATLEVALNEHAGMYQGIGPVPALLERLREWIWRGASEEVRHRVLAALQPVVVSTTNLLPPRLGRALEALLKDGEVVYHPHDYHHELASRYSELTCSGRSGEAAVIARYALVQRGENGLLLKQALEEADSAVETPAPSGSRCVSRWLDGLRGLEIGPSSHNDFGLNAKNVGMRDPIYEEEQLRSTGRVARIDIEALADRIPVPNESEDFIFSSHVIEHCPDLINTLLEWFRIVRPGGIIYMIVPGRNASPGDVGKQLTTWEHAMNDFQKRADRFSEPEAGLFGHCHYHVFDPDSMHCIVERIFDARLELVERQDVDDKVGNGFALVYRKRSGIDSSLPWPLWEQFLSRRVAKFVNICMVTYNRLEFTRQSIESIAGRTDYPYVLTVVDNNSQDGTREYLKQMKQQGVIKNLVLLDENIGVAKGSNLAWSQEPEAEYYLKLDNDIVIRKNCWLSPMVAALEAIPELGAVGYNFEPVSYPLQVVNGQRIRPKQANIGGACYMISKRTERILGFWCEDYGLYGEEDGEYSLRLRVAGLANAYLEDEDMGVHLPGGKAGAIDEVTKKALDDVELGTHFEYRTWKDEQRRHLQQPGGLLHRNCHLYQSGERSIYVTRGEFLGKISPEIQLFDRKNSLAFLPLNGTLSPSQREDIRAWCLQNSITFATVTLAEENGREILEVAHKAERVQVTASIVIPVFNKVEFTRLCLETLYVNTPRDLFELIIIDNASSDGTAEYLAAQEGPGVQIISNAKNVGYTIACNQGAAKASGKYIVFLNNDTEPQKGWLENLVLMAEHDLRVGAVGAKLIYPDGRLQEAGAIIFSDGSNYSIGSCEDPKDPRFNTPRVVDYCTGACLMVRHDLFRKIGGFDERYAPAYYEDPDICFAIADLGYYVVYCPQSEVIHHESVTAGFDLVNGIKKHYFINREKFVEKWGRVLAGKLARPALPGQATVKSCQEPEAPSQKLPCVMVDGVFYQMNATGIARVWTSLLSQWAGTDFGRGIVVLDRAGTAPRVPGIRYRNIPGYVPGEPDRAMLQKVCDDEGADLFISTYYTTPLSTPSLFLAHDMIPEFTDFYDLADAQWQEKHHAISRASAFVAVSRSTAKDLAKLYPDLEGRIVVAHNGIDHDVFSSASKEEVQDFRKLHGLDKPYFLFVGMRQAYKNGLLPLNALNLLPNKGSFTLLYVGGGPALEPEVKRLAGDLDVRLAKLSDRELICAYSGAAALIYPSTYEGFGLPILEAMACRCPVITCQNSSIPEVAGAAALYVSESDPRELSEAMLQITAIEVRQHLIHMGTRQVAKFSWKKMADIIQEVIYREFPVR
uniref:Glycosyl transferase family 2 n=1 Tax=Geobacter sp. (strain M21) TaxID=443144 RepID=C6E7H8_GEOSM